MVSSIQLRSWERQLYSEPQLDLKDSTSYTTTNTLKKDHLKTWGLSFSCDVVIVRYDYRIKYFNLKKTRSQNALALEDVHRLWIPFLVFDNTEKNEATKVFNFLIFTDFFLLDFLFNFSLFVSNRL